MIEMGLDVRLDILRKSNLLSDESYTTICKVQDWFASQGLTLTEENGAAFITHLCAALERMRKGEPVTALDDTVYQLAKEESSFAKAEQLCAELCRLLPPLPECERQYITLHMGTMLASLGQ